MGRTLVERIATGTDDERIRATWRGLLPALVAQLGQVLGIVAVSVLMSPGPNGQTSPVVALATLLAMGLVVAATAGVALAVAARLDRRSYADYGIARSPRWLCDLLGGIVIGVLMVGVVAVYLQARGYATVILDVSASGGAPGPLLSAGIGIGLLVYFLANNVYEEIVFRGIMLRNFADGLTARSVSLLPAVAGAMGGSLVVFGVFHPLPPGGGGLHAATTSAGLGLVFALAYVLTGELAVPIGIHFGGVFLLSMRQEAVLGLTLPTIVVLEFTTIPTYEVLFVRVLVGVVLVLGWLYHQHGELTVAEPLRS